MIQNVLTQEAPPGVPDQSENPVERVFQEDELRIVRRLDWRFLLADPNLKEVAYIGPDDKDLVDSLRYFSDVFTRFEWAESDAPHNQVKRDSRGRHFCCRQRVCVAPGAPLSRTRGSARTIGLCVCGVGLTYLARLGPLRIFHVSPRRRLEQILKRNQHVFVGPFLYQIFIRAI